MAPIEQITIAGFRGILAPLTLDFVKGSSPRSMAIYGRNGTGKSSITDAWEWFHTGRIEHLAREGARERSFPHRDSKSGETFVKVQFSGKELGTVRLNFDHSRVTMPSSQGDIKRFRELVPHPCHVRFEDLTGFVYLTKTEKYDRLAGLMGFQEQVRVQKALQRVLRPPLPVLPLRRNPQCRGLPRSQTGSHILLPRSGLVPPRCVTHWIPARPRAPLGN